MDTAPEMPWWQRIGTLIDSYELPLINPYDPGYPAWPQADRSVRLLASDHGTRLVVTDGLGGADLPEYYVETSEPVEQLSGHWATNLIIEIGRLVPTNPDGIAAMLDQHGLLSLELEIDGAPAD